MEETGREMPRYKCHKVVWALKIKKIELDIDVAQKENRESDGGAYIYPEEGGYAKFKVNHSFMKRHEPEEGGYYIVYEGGYKSYSPAEAFEKGYSKM